MSIIMGVDVDSVFIGSCEYLSAAVSAQAEVRLE